MCLAWHTVRVPNARPPSAPRRATAGTTRRRVIAVVGAVVVALVSGAPASAGSASLATDIPNLGPANPGTAVCTVNNPNLDEVTGLVASSNDIYAVEGGDTFDPSSVQIWTINPTTCQASSRNYGFDPADPQDLALGTDGALWLADTGDGIGSDNQRVRVTMERVDPASSAPAVPYRAQYPDSGKINAQAVLLQKDNTPILIANASGKAILYRPSAALQANAENGLPKLTEAGEFTPAKTGTANPLGGIGNAIVTGAATSPDRTRVVIRTASDAYEFKVGSDGDLVKAITTVTPVITPLPDEENGQAITYSADGKLFLTLSSAKNPVLRSYQPYVPPAPTGDAGTAAGNASSSKLSFSDITNIAAVVGFLGFVAVVAGIIGIYRARKRYRERGEWSDEEAEGEYSRYDRRTQPRRERGPRPTRPERGGGEDRRRQWDDEEYGRPPRGRPPRTGARPDGWGPGGNKGDGHGGGHPAPPPGPPPPPPPAPAATGARASGSRCASVARAARGDRYGLRVEQRSGLRPATGTKSRRRRATPPRRLRPRQYRPLTIGDRTRPM